MPHWSRPESRAVARRPRTFPRASRRRPCRRAWTPSHNAWGMMRSSGALVQIHSDRGRMRMTRFPVSGSRTFSLRFQAIRPMYNGLFKIPMAFFSEPAIVLHVHPITLRPRAGRGGCTLSSFKMCAIVFGEYPASYKCATVCAASVRQNRTHTRRTMVHVLHRGLPAPSMRRSLLTKVWGVRGFIGT